MKRLILFIILIATSYATHAEETISSDAKIKNGIELCQIVNRDRFDRLNDSMFETCKAFVIDSASKFNDYELYTKVCHDHNTTEAEGNPEVKEFNCFDQANIFIPYERHVKKLIDCSRENQDNKATCTLRAFLEKAETTKETTALLDK